ncbi:MAG: GNAT family N-acetyltransferase [Promethearchaeota archaeon]
MKNIQIQTEKLDALCDVQELASLTIKMWKFTRPDLNPTVERFGNWIKNLKYTAPPIIVKAYREEILVGWVLLFVHDSKRIEINPWALGGHPHIVYDDPDKVKITKLLLQECMDYATKNDYTRVEFCYEPKDTVEEYPIDPFIYPECGFQKVDGIVFMTRDLPEKEEDNSQIALQKGIKTILLKDTSDDDLYSCFYDSFSKSGARNVLSLSDEEKKEYFHSYYNRTDEMIDDASIALVKGTKIIGFTFVRPTHGEGNGTLYGIGVVPEFRGIQLGSRLLNHVIMTLKTQGYKTMSLAVDIENKAALKLYEKYEFVKEWRRITHAWKKEMVDN